MTLDRFDELKRLAAEALEVPSGSPRAELMAAIRLAFERSVEQLAAGRDRFDFSAFNRIIELLEKFAPPPPAHRLEVSYVDRRLSAYICTACHHVLDSCPSCGTPLPQVEPSSFTPPPPDSPPDRPPPNGGGSNNTDARAAAASSPATNNVVPLSRSRGVSLSGFHDQVLPSAEVAPLKRLQPGYGADHAGVLG